MKYLKFKTPTNQNLKQKKAFTLVEILTVVFLGSLIIMASYSVYLMSYKSYKKQSASAELTQNARIALERMSRDIRQSSDVVTDLQIDQENSSSEIEFQNGHTTTPIQYIDYKLVGTDLHYMPVHYAFHFEDTSDLWVKHDELINGLNPLRIPGNPEIKAQNITVLKFWETMPAIHINLTVSDNTTSYQFETTSYGRNL